MPKQPKIEEEENRPKWVNPKQQQAEVDAPKWVNPKNQQEGEEARPKWVNPKKAQGEENRPKWVNPNKGQKQERAVQPRSRQWQNPKWQTARQRMDKRLERAGLLNYQTAGLSQAEIAHRYAMAGISISDNSTWFKENYGADAPETITDRSKMFQYRSDVFAGKNPSIGAPGAGQAPTSGPVIAAGGKADRPQNYVKGANGLLVKAPNQPMGAVTDSPYAKQVFATNAQALKGEVNWADVSSTERTKLLNDPNFYKSGQITQYPAWMQQQILADPNFKWDNLPAWQKTYFELSASPAGMGATQGALMGVAGGPVGGAVGAALGGALGWAAAKSGYDPMKEFWQQENKTAGAFGLMNWLAEQAEKTVGLAIQTVGAITNPKEVGGLDEIYGDKERLRTAWDAGSVTFEVIAPYVSDVPKMFGEVIEKTRNGMAFNDAAAEVLNSRDSGPLVTVLGSDEKVSQGYGNMFEAFAKARGEIDQGKPYREVMMELQNSVTAQLGDMVGQATADPLNFLPDMQTKIGGKIAEAGGNKVAAEAFRGSDSLVDAGRKYKTLVQSGQALTIDPNFKVDQMGRFSRFVAGINDQGQVKAGSLIGTKQGLLDPVKGKTGWLEDMTTQTPISRAQTGAGMFYDNVSAMLTMFKSPDEAIRYIKSVAKGDMESWANYGKQFAESPEFYTVLPALKDFDANVLDGMAQTWEMAAPNRDLLGRVADVMGDNPGSLLEDLARNGTAEQDFARLLKMAQESDSPNAKAILADIEAGRLNAATLKEMVDVFTGEGALPWHEGQWKAMMLDKMGSHFDEWVTKRLMLDKSPEAVSAFFRTSALLKQAQSILLLGGSPGYAITNGLSNMVHRAVSGVFGYMTGKQIDSFMDRMGMKPARLEEGVGIGGVVEQAAGSSKVQTSAMDKAVRGKGAITTAKDMLSKLSKGMPFNKVSSFFEKGEGRQAFAIGMKDFWSQSWRRGVGFREMSPELVKAMGEMGMDPQRVYAAIEAGMNQTEIEKALMGRQSEVQARGLIHDAAQKTGMTASEAATMLERTGVLDTLDKFLAGQTTREGVAGAFRRAESVAQDWMDMKMGEDLKAKAENVKQRVGLEGAAAALDVAQKAHGEFTDAWLDHYHRFGEVMQDLQMLDDPLMKDKAIDQAYNISDREFRRVFANNAANYKGIFEAWGMSGDVKALRVLESIGEVDNAMAGAYRSMRENIRAWREAWAGDLKNPQRWDEWNKVQAQNEAAFKKGFKAKHEAEVKQGAALGEVYESLYGPAAGEAARLWWEDVIEFGDEITKQENEFRQGVKDARAAGALAEDIAAEKQKYYSEKKPVMIAELEKINNEGIARLERVIRGGDGGGVPVSGDPVPGGPSNVEGVGSQVEGIGSKVEPTANDPETVSRWMESQYAKPARASEQTATPGRVDRVEELNALMAAAEQRKGRDAAEAEGRKAAVWDVAEEYWGKGGNYNRGILQDGFALVAALKKPEYGGIPDLTWLDDPRLTPELARQILENRKAAKEAAGVEAAAKVISEKPKGRGVKAENLNLLQAIQRHGGLNLEVAKDLMGEKKPKSAPGVWQKKGFNKGWDMSDMARFLADDGYPIDLNHPNDPGGVGQATELLRRALVDKEKIYPMGHDFDADLAKAEAAYYAEIDGTFPEGSVFDAALWQSEFDTAVRGADLGRVYELIGDVPEEQLGVWKVESGKWATDIQASIDEIARLNAERARLGEIEIVPTEDGGAFITFLDRSKNKLTPDYVAKYNGIDGVRDEVLRTQNNIIDSKIGMEERRIQERDGVTWRDYLSRTADEVAARASEDGTMERVAGKAAEVEQVLADAEYHAAAVTKRAMVLEGMAEAFGLNEKETAAYGEMNDAVAEWYARQTGQGVDDFYNRYFGEARKSVPGAGDQVSGDGLMQQAYHGSPYKFDKFTLDKIGSGEGAQAYGWGLYFAGDKAVADWYRQKLSPGISYNGKEITKNNLRQQFPGATDDFIRVLSDRLNTQSTSDLRMQYESMRYGATGSRKKTASALLKQLKVMEPYFGEGKSGQLYNVEIPDDNYLLWDKPLSEQPQAVKDAVKRLTRDTGEYLALEDALSGQAENIQNAVKVAAERIVSEATNKLDYKEASAMSRYLDNYDWNKTGAEIYNDLVSVAGSESDVLSALNIEGVTLKEKLLSEKSTGSDIYEMINSDPKAASLALKEAGINGIQYLDGSSRGKGEGSYNYVIFDEAAIQVKETFYQRDVSGVRSQVSGKPQPIKNEGGVDIYAEKILTSNARANLDIGTETTRLAPVSNVKKNYKVEVVDYWVIPDKPFEPVFKVYEEVLHKGNIGNTWREVKKFPNWVGKEGDALVKALSSETKQPDMFGATRPADEGIPGTFDKGMVTFEGVKGTITAFEAADFSTVIHETGHIYRRMLADVAERTKNPYVLRDLTTIEEWAGVKDGNWTRDAEEKFARGFERYVTEGNAPTPKLKAAFESFRTWMLEIYKTITGSSIDVKLTDEVKRVFDRMLGQEEQFAQGFDPATQWVDTTGRVHMKVRAELDVDMGAAKENAKAILAGDMGEKLRQAAEARKAQVEGPAALFQSEPSIPFGMYDEQSGFRASGDGLDALWREKVSPLLRAMEEGATSQVSGIRFGEGAALDVSPEGQAMLKKYMEQVKGDMATAKLATVRYAEKTRDFALLNYSKRYGFDRAADAVMPYQFYASRSGVNWAARMLDKPALYSNYARLRMQQERYERDIPERMRGKIKIAAPWLPEWAGDGLYIDPMRNLFFPETIMRAFERKQQDKNYQVIEAERVLQEWQAGGQYSDQEIIDAAKTQQGKVWDRAWAEAQIRRESDTANPVDFFTSFFGPAWYLSTPLNLAGVKVPGISKGDPNKVNTTPLGNTARALDTVTQGTWAEPFGDLVGLIGKAEDKAREAFKLPTRGEYAEYYTKRQVANMVAEGKITSEQAQIAMIEKSGPYWDEAKQRVDMELALRVPLAGVTYAALHGGPKAAAQAAVPSLFGASLLPAGELEFRGLKQEWNEAWKLADAGDTKAVSRFFDNHPEYEAYLAKNKDDGELLKSFLIGSVWDAYMEMGTTNQKQARAELGEAFQQSFLDKETRSYETLTTEQLAAWTQLLGKYVPTPAGQGQVPGVTGQVSGQVPGVTGQVSGMRLYPEQVTAITDQYFEQRSEKFPNYYTEQSGYYALPKSERKAYLREHPNLKAYWDWKDRWYTSYPEYVPIFNGNAFDRVDTSGWMPGLEESVREAAMAGDSLPDGARAALMNEWMLGGQPMGNFDTWVTSVVMPGMLYGN